jgi:hypothetical protein
VSYDSRRRVNALVIRKRIEELKETTTSSTSSSSSGAPKARAIVIKKYLKRQGWDSLNTFTDYTRGFQHLAGSREDMWFPHEAKRLIQGGSQQTPPPQCMSAKSR